MARQTEWLKKMRKKVFVFSVLFGVTMFAALMYDGEGLKIATSWGLGTFVASHIFSRYLVFNNL